MVTNDGRTNDRCAWLQICSLTNKVSPLFHCTKMMFSIKDFFSKWYQIRSFLRIWSHLPKKSLIENFIFRLIFISSYEMQCPNWSRLSTSSLNPVFLLVKIPSSICLTVFSLPQLTL